MYVVFLMDDPGTKLWPLTDEYYPTGLMPLSNNKPLLAEAISRLPAKVNGKNIFVVASFESIKALHESKVLQVFNIPNANIIRIPEHKGTALSMLFATHYIQRRVKDLKETDTIAFCPVDQYFWPAEAFTFHFNNITLAAESEPEKLFSMVLTPGGPSTYVDYVQADWKTLSTMGITTVVDEEKENGLSTISLDLIDYETKPVTLKAQDLMGKNWLWSLSTYVGSIRMFKHLWSTYLPTIDEEINSFFTKYLWYLTLIIRTKRLSKIWSDLPTTPFSTDVYRAAIKAGLVRAGLISSLIWSSISDWVSIKHLLFDSGLFNNTEVEGVHLVDSERNLIYKPDGKEVALFGVNDLIIIDAGDKLLIGTPGGLYDRF